MNTVFTRKTKRIEYYSNTIKTEKYGHFICKEVYTNGKLTEQFFRNPGITHSGYEPQNMKFYYFGGKINTFEISQKYIEREYRDIPKPIFIDDLKSFKDFKNLYCIWVPMDSCIYRLTDSDPLPVTMRVGLHEYKLDECEKKLKKTKGVSNIHYDSIQWSKYLHFDYKVSTKTILEMNKTKAYFREQIIIDKLGLGKFKYKERYYDDNDDDDDDI